MTRLGYAASFWLCVVLLFAVPAAVRFGWI